MCLDVKLWNEFENRPFWYPAEDSNSASTPADPCSVSAFSTLSLLLHKVPFHQRAGAF